MRRQPTTVESPAAWAVVVVWVAKLFVCVALGIAARDKLLGTQSAVEMFQHLDMEPVGRLVIGALEALAVVMLLIPQSTAYGALLGLGVMIGAVIGHLTEPELGIAGIQWALAVAVCCVVVLWFRRADAEFIDNLVDR